MTVSGNTINVQFIELHLILDDNRYSLVTVYMEKQYKFKKKNGDRWSALNNIDATTTSVSSVLDTWSGLP